MSGGYEDVQLGLELKYFTKHFVIFFVAKRQNLQIFVAFSPKHEIKLRNKYESEHFRGNPMPNIWFVSQ